MKTICFRRHNCFLNSVKMEDSESQLLADEEQTPEPLLSSLDIFLFSLIVGLLIYWFFFRKKTEPVPEIKPFTPVTPQIRETSFIEKMKKTNRNIVVFYGSQTGTAEEFANRLAKDAQRYGMKGMAADPEEYDLSELSRLKEIPNSMTVFCMATYGEGDPTDNAQEFYDWMQGTDDDLEGVNFAVFGLGNKTYEHFNATGKYTDKRLAELGGKRVFDLGLGDDDINLEEDFISWKEQFWPAVCEFFGVEATGEDSSIRQFELVVHNDINMNQVYNSQLREKTRNSEIKPFDSKNPFLATVTGNRKLNKGGNRHLMHIEFDITDSKISFILYCINNTYTILLFYYRNIILYFYIKYNFFFFALYQSWVLDSERNILAILEDLPSLNPPIDHLCELLPRLQARYYSIASSSKVYPTSIHICAVVIEYTTKTERVFKGVATNWLKNKEVTDNGHKLTIPMYVRRSQFRLPFKPSNPIIMIGPGTGIAPFMGFIRERAWQKKQGKEAGETILYFGCRHKNEDFLYQQELEEFERAGVLTQLNVAFSRDQEHKIYVQHLLKKNKEQLWKLIHSNNAHIYVCGDARNMARDVHTAFYEIAEEVGSLTHTQAVDYFKKLMTKGRYSQDVWS
uniref:NADPH--hemoprotein reductase n=1 Tax=Sinocyclocheilus rhinocerous TaxID=307959 RepID=A0A673MPM6_9TELE